MPERIIIVEPVEETKEGLPVAVLYVDIAARCNVYKRIMAITGTPEEPEPFFLTACMN